MIINNMTGHFIALTIRPGIHLIGVPKKGHYLDLFLSKLNR
jgi:hypothetical protein